MFFNEDVTEIIRGGQIGNCRIGNMEHDIVVGLITRTAAARGTGDPEREIPGAVPIESPGGCDQSWGVSIDRDIRQDDANPVEFERLEVCRTRLHEKIRTIQMHCDIDSRPVLRQRHGAKRRGAAPARAMVAGEEKGVCLGRRRRHQQTCDEKRRNQAQSRNTFNPPRWPLSYP